MMMKHNLGEHRAKKTRGSDSSFALLSGLGDPDSLLSSLRSNAFCSFEEWWYHLNLFKCLRVKSYLLNLQSFKIYGGTCYVRLNETGPT